MNDHDFIIDMIGRCQAQIGTEPPKPIPPEPIPPDVTPVPPNPIPGTGVLIGDLGWTNGNPLHVNYIPNQDYYYTISVPANAVQFSVRFGEVPGTPTGTNRAWLVNPAGSTVNGPTDFTNKYGSLAEYSPMAGVWQLHIAPNYTGPSVTQLNH